MRAADGVDVVQLVLEFAIDGMRRWSQPRDLPSLHSWFHVAVSWELRASASHDTLGAPAALLDVYLTTPLHSTQLGWCADHVWRAWVNGTRVKQEHEQNDAEFQLADRPQHAELLLGQSWLPEAAKRASAEHQFNASVARIDDVMLDLKPQWLTTNASAGSKTAENLNASLAFLGELARVHIWREVRHAPSEAIIARLFIKFSPLCLCVAAITLHLVGTVLVCSTGSSHLNFLCKTFTDIAKAEC